MEKKKSKHYLEITSANKPTLGLKELVANWELIYFLVWRDIKVKYKQTVLGILWAILQPFIMMLIFTFFVRGALKISSEDISYPVFAFSGFLLWTVFSAGLTNASVSMLNNVNMIKKIYFPRIIIPVSSIMVNVFDFLIGFFVLIGLLIYMRQPINIWQAIAFWPISLILVVISTLGPGCCLAALNIKYRDFRHVTPFGIQMLLFLSPVIYPLSTIKHEWVKYVLALNPMYAALNLFRAPMMSTVPEGILLAISFLSGIFFLVVGVAYFKSAEAHFADIG